ncbi:MAG: class I tRNA ligase family protein, partial [Patescibacteria group bacterium]
VIMSKSKGNYVPVLELIEKYGVDVLRWYFLSSMTIGESKSVIPREIEDKQKGFFGTLGNCVRFYELYAVDKATWTHDTKPSELTDKWVLSKLHGLVNEVTENLDNYDPTTAARAIEKFVVEDFSNWWLRRSRKRKEALGLLRFVLLHLAKTLAPFTPFMAEDIKTRMHKFQKAGHESVHLNDWPKADKKFIDKELEKQMDEIRNIVTLGLAQRKEKQIKVRQPLRAVHLGLSNEFPEDLEVLIQGELNVKEVVYDKSQKELVILDSEFDEALIHEGYARELMRQIQDMRKEAKYKVDDEIFGQWHSENPDLSAAINKWSDEIKKDVLLKNFENHPHGDEAYDVEKEFELAIGKKIWLGIKK